MGASEIILSVKRNKLLIYWVRDILCIIIPSHHLAVIMRILGHTNLVIILFSSMLYWLLIIWLFCVICLSLFRGMCLYYCLSKIAYLFSLFYALLFLFRALADCELRHFRYISTFASAFGYKSRSFFVGVSVIFTYVKGIYWESLILRGYDVHFSFEVSFIIYLN